MSPPRSTTLRSILAATLAASFTLVANAIPQPQAQETVAPSPKVWVSVNAQTTGATITPSVVTDAGGAKHTENAPPEYLTKSKEYSSFNKDGLVATYTSLNPAPTAAAINNPRGEFLACAPQQSRDEPFCAPKRDSILKLGRGYYITWNTLYFGSPNQRVQISVFPAELPSVLGSSPAVNLSALPSFPIVKADNGFAFFPLPRAFFPSADDAGDEGDRNLLTRLNITMSVWASGNYDHVAPTEIKQGPIVYVTSGYDSDNESDDEGGGDLDDDDDIVTSPGLSTGKKIAISVPVAIVSVLVLGGLIAFAVWGYKKNGHVPFIGGLFGKRRGGGGGGGGSGYGVRKSYSERVGKRDVAGVEEGVTRGAGDFKSGGGGGVELTDRESWSPTSPTSARLNGENVFRAEVERQERDRQR
ncbi:hypothetical protein B0T20DRAFT_120680 [Sordaria brevicollis]|uniref:Uncharacterized protein n=1 Tax=Sordaria brevicollis TaxID=83679 RepID=A0AAE0PKR0_SORBR|nr:hypothetical protein B0T20DRAFT_120680 [Sordaria brevicollis]